jgi:hypothetical protein
MPVGSLAADCRQLRTAVHVKLPPDLTFLDVESPATHQFLRSELALGLSAIGLNDLDVSAVRGPNRQVTQLISEWAYTAADGEQPLYAGIRYESRIRSGWECWALFDDEELEIEVDAKSEKLSFANSHPRCVATFAPGLAHSQHRLTAVHWMFSVEVMRLCSNPSWPVDMGLCGTKA